MRYRYIRLRAGVGGSYYSRTESGKKPPRQVIDDMAAAGYRFVGCVPVSLGMHGSLLEYDMIFERI